MIRQTEICACDASGEGSPRRGGEEAEALGGNAVKRVWHESGSATRDQEEWLVAVLSSPDFGY